jgi:23S rRNA G2445 N2-methylase RlmL
MNTRSYNKDSRTLIAFTTKGLEHITEKEIKAKFPQAQIRDILTKRIIFQLHEVSLKKLLKLKTVDDVHLLVKSFENVEYLSEDFILKHLPINELKDTINFISKFQCLSENFSITMSRYKSPINLKSLKLKVGKKIKKHLNMEYTLRDHTNFEIRIHLEGSNVSFSCRLSEASLYKRKYIECQQKGALKPTIAAALCLLVSPNKNEKIVDNFCGTGTILCEAKLQGLEPYGGDINIESVNCAHLNMKNISLEAVKNIKVLDATSTKWPNNYFDYAISNYPWGKQVDLKGIVKLYSTSIAEYSRILKKDGSIVLLGMKPDLIVKHLKKNFPTHKIIKFKIGFLGQTPWVVCALSQNKPKILLYKNLK